MTEMEQLAEERAMLVRFCAHYTGDPQVAEDLAQQTLLRAWQHERELRDPQARRGWLFSIARNICLMWGRHDSRERARRLDCGSLQAQEIEDRLADDVDLEVELERDELAGLLDRALGLLPAETREVLVRRYVEDLPQAEVAALLGLSKGAVEARIQRGKLVLKRVLSTELSDAALSYGIVRQDEVGWQPTRLWCPGCGKRRLEGWLQSEAGRLDLRCPNCAPLPHNYYVHSHMGNGLRRIHTYKPALRHVLAGIHYMFRTQAAGGGMNCPSCGRWIELRQSKELGIHLQCAACEWLDHETWHSLTWSLPQVRDFWREHPRMRFLAEREIEVGGLPAVVTGFESLGSGARIEVVTLRDTLEVTSIHREAGRSA